MLFGVAVFLDFQKADAWDKLSLELHMNSQIGTMLRLSWKHSTLAHQSYEHQEQKVLNYLQRNPEKVCDKKY